MIQTNKIETLVITRKERYDDYFQIHFTFNGVSHRVNKYLGVGRFSKIIVNSTAKEAELDLLDVLKIEVELNKQTKFI